MALGVQHLQLLGVKYFMAETPEIEQQANADPSLQLVAKTGPWTYTYNSVLIHTTWEIYLVKDSPLVTPLRNEPAVLSGVDPAPSGWLEPVTGLVRPPEPLERRAGAGRTGVVAADDGGRHAAAGAARGDDAGDRRRDRPTPRSASTCPRWAHPVLVKVSYFPNWHASGADGPWRVTPNLMVVVPTSHDVTLILRPIGRGLPG